MWSMQKAIAELHNIFHALNKEIFNNDLPEPAITIQSKGKRNALGWCSVNPIWMNKDSTVTKHEINICAENADMPVLQIVEIMLHEMVHYYCELKGIKTTSRNGTFHNKKYKNHAEQFGLIVEKTQKYGYSETKLSAATLQKVESMNFDQEAFLLMRVDDEGQISKKRGSIKHTCPGCGNVARTTKDMILICGKCDEQMDNDAEDED